jgi:uncharacterized protein YdhG (YjbR/CyaY superfamily)
LVISVRDSIFDMECAPYGHDKDASTRETKRVIKGKYTTIDEYIALQPLEIREALERLRHTIKKTAPRAEEVISYQMPGFRLQGILVWFAVFKNHYSLFTRPRVLDKFRDQLKVYTLTKSAIQIPLNKQLPVKLTISIVKYAVGLNQQDAALKSAPNKKKAKK